MWIGWLSAGGGIATFTTVGSSFDTVLAVYSGSSVEALTELGSDDDSGGFLNSSVSFNTEVGVTYRIAVDGYNGATGDIVLNWSYQSTTNEIPVITVHPTNQAVALTSPVTFTVELAPSEMGLSFQWLFNGSPISGTDSNAFSIPSVVEPDAGQYSVRISRGSVSVGSLSAELQIHDTGPEVQQVFVRDKLADALASGQYLLLGNPGGVGGGEGSGGGLARSYTGTQVFNNQTSGSESGEPLHCGVVGGASSWFVYSAQENGVLDINTDGSTFDTVLALYFPAGGGFGDLIPLACDDNSGLDGEDSAVSYPVVAGELYAVAVDGVGGASGTVVLNLSLLVRAQLTSMGQMPSGENIVRLEGQPEGQFQIQHSMDLVSWTPLVTTNLATGLLDFIHYGSTNLAQSFYRATTLSTE